MAVGAITQAFTDANWHLMYAPGDQYILSNKCGQPFQVAFTREAAEPVIPQDRHIQLGGATGEVVTLTDRYTWVRAISGTGELRIRDIGTLDPEEDITYVARSTVQAHQRLDAHEANLDNPHQVTKSQVGLGAIPNAISDSPTTNNPNCVASSAAVAAATKIATDHIQDRENPHDTTKAQVGLSEVENYPPADESAAIDTANDHAYMTPAKTALHIEKLVFISSAVRPQTVVKGAIGARPAGWGGKDCSSPPTHTIKASDTTARIKAGLVVAYADRGKVRVSSPLAADITLPMHQLGSWDIEGLSGASPSASVYLGTGAALYIYLDMSVEGYITRVGLTDKAPAVGMARDGAAYDFFNVAECVMYSPTDVPLRRVYIARVIGYNNIIGSVIPVPIGTEYILPIEQSLVLSGRYLLNNPFIERVRSQAEVDYTNVWGPTSWNDQIGVLAHPDPNKPEDYLVLQCGQMGFLSCGRESGTPFGSNFVTVTSPLRARINITKKY